MATIQIFDPVMCCSTGVCGVEVIGVSHVRTM